MSIKGPSLVAWGVAVSLAVHVGAAVGIKRLPPKSITTSTFVSVVEQKKPEKKKPLPKKEAPKEEPKKEEPKLPKAPPKVAPPPPVAPPPEAPPPPAANPNAFAGNPGLAGLKTIGPINGDGLAIPQNEGPQGGGPSPTASGTTKQKEKVLGAPKTNGGGDGAGAAGPGECGEPVTKPKPTSMPQPSYSDEARSAEVEGVVQVRVRVDASGHVVEATVVKSLGHGLDERAVAAAKQWVFSPGTKCGAPAESTFVMNMRFALGE